MLGTVMHAPGDIRVEDRPEPVVQKPTDGGPAPVRQFLLCP